MSAVSLSWHSLPYDKSKFFVKGTALSQAIIPGTLSRFAIQELRTLESDGFSGVTFRVVDAATVTLQQVKEGETPKPVFRSDSIEECVSWAQAQFALDS